MKPQEIFENWLEGTVHEEAQVDESGVHVTVGGITKLHWRGSVDFGGSELKGASEHQMEAVEHEPGDRHGWWRLPAGHYLVHFNEKVKEGAPCLLLVSSPRLLGTGCSVASTVVTPGEIQSVLTVPECGVRIKENARIAILLG